MSDTYSQELATKKFIDKYKVEVSQEWLNNFYEVRDSLDAPKGVDWRSNQILVFNEGEALGRYNKKDNRVVKISGGKENMVYGVKARGFEQMAAFNLLMDPDIQLVTLSGIAGSGKSFLCMAAALEQVVGKKIGHGNRQYEKIIILRPNSSVGRSMGLLPGTADEKYFNLVKPVISLIDKLAGRETQGLLEEGIIVAEPIEFIRGDTFENAIVILDEAQNVDPHVMKTIITRIDQTSKLYICGDTRQVDERGDMRTRNGLTEVIDKMQKGSDNIVAEVVFYKSERKGIAALATSRLEDY